MATGYVRCWCCKQYEVYYFDSVDENGKEYQGSRCNHCGAEGRRRYKKEPKVNKSKVG